MFAPNNVGRMKIKKNYILSPGPTAIPSEISLAGALPMIHHRTPQFQKVIKEVAEGLKYFFVTENPVYFVPSSGTGVMEMAIANLTSQGETILVVEGGKFGERWSEIARAFHLNVIPIKIEYGKAIQPAQIEEALKKNPEAKGVFTQLSETSTGCVYDIEAIGKVVSKTEALFVVDGISGLGAEPCYPDQWGVDCILTGSQKGVMLPPGLGFISVSPKAWKKIEQSKNPRFYFDLKSYRKALQSDDSPYTPAISLLFQLQEALKIVKSETIEGVWARHGWLANATRAGVQALNLELFAERPGNILTSVKVPAGLDGEKIVKMMRDDLGVTIAGGQGEMKGKVLRIAHLGYVDRFDVIVGISALEIAMKRLGASVKLGTGLAAAQEALWQDPKGGL
ncbi:MAG: alanine--glyoxylate aminotransferase family protein [Deltaproteobacteria bacterium]|nr:alanine--glyoxylate aminotransferase family protein [Deltaproteobacteria bacterium]